MQLEISKSKENWQNLIKETVLTLYAAQTLLLDVTISAYSAQSQWIGKLDIKTKFFTTVFLYKTVCLCGSPRFVTVLLRQ